MDVPSSPQPVAVGEHLSNLNNNTKDSSKQESYAGCLNKKQNPTNLTKTILKKAEILHGIPTIQFTMEEREAFAKEEGLHQAIVIKLSNGAPNLEVLRTLLPKFLRVKGNSLLGSLSQRQLLLRLDQHEDFVVALARSVNYLPYNGKKHQVRIFPWSIGFNPNEETSMAAVWISLPSLSPDLFARASLLSIAAAVGRPIAVDKATQVRSRPSTARVRVIVDLLDKLPNKIKIQSIDKKTGKIIDVVQEVVYDNLPLYCSHCKHQGHDESSCRQLVDKTYENDQVDEDIGDKYIGDLRQLLNERKAMKKDANVLKGPQVNHAHDGMNGGVSVGTKDHSTQEVGNFSGVSVPVAAAKIACDRDEQTVVKHMGHRVGCMSEHDLILQVGPLKKVESTLVGQKNKILDDFVDNFDLRSVNTCELLTTNSKVMHKDLIVGVGSTKCTDLGMQVGHLGDVISVEKNAGQQMVGKIQRKDGCATVGNLTAETTLLENKKGLRVDSTNVLIGLTHLEQKIEKNEGHSGDITNIQAGIGVVGSLELFKEENMGHVHHFNAQHEHEAAENTPNTIDNVGTCKVKKENTKALVGQKVNSIVQSQDEQNVKVGVFDILKFKDGGHLNLAFERNASTFEKVENVAIGSHGTHVLEKNQKNVGHFDLENEPKNAHGEGSQVEQNSDKAAFGDVASNIGSFSNNKLSNEQIGFQAHSSSVPTLYFSNPQVEEIINDAHNEMTRNTPIFKQPLVTLNTSVFEVPTQSAESIGDFEGASGQQLVSTGNNNEIVMISTGNKNEVHEKQESARKVSYSDCKAVTSSKRRQILMRAAKQKGIASSTSTRSNKSNKK